MVDLWKDGRPRAFFSKSRAKPLLCDKRMLNGIIYQKKSGTLEGRARGLWACEDILQLARPLVAD
jgi:hypothetical protein